MYEPLENHPQLSLSTVKGIGIAYIVTNENNHIPKHTGLGSNYTLCKEILYLLKIII